jgi:hypothetical protein
LEQDIRQWISDGWTFRIKNSNGKSYITRRRKGEERGLGLYNQETWRRICALAHREQTGTNERTLAVLEEVASIKKELSEQESLIKALSEQLRTLKLEQESSTTAHDDRLEKLETSRSALRASSFARVDPSKNNPFRCINLDADGICKVMLWPSDYEYITQRSLVKEGGDIVDVKDDPEICAVCRKYKPRRAEQ